MLSKNMLEALNSQITKEFYSAYLYLSMAGYFEVETLQGFAHWMRIQAQEESSHAMILFNYVTEQGAAVKLGVIDAPPGEFSSALQVFEKVVSHEQAVTASINKLMDIAVQEHDYASRQMLDWFIGEQVEEEANATALVSRLKRIGDSGPGIEQLDKELVARMFTVPPPLVGKL